MWRLWLVVAVLFAVAAGFGVYQVINRETAVVNAELSPVLRRQLADRVVRTVEADREAGKTVLPGDRVVCAARVFGSEPPEVTAASQVDTVYARLYCVEVRADGAPGARTAVPAAVHFGDTVTVECPRDDAAWSDDVDRIFPSRLRRAAGRDDPGVQGLRADVDRRISEMPPR